MLTGNKHYSSFIFFLFSFLVGRECVPLFEASETVPLVSAHIPVVTDHKMKVVFNNIKILDGN